jgi:hypothetical protein
MELGNEEIEINGERVGAVQFSEGSGGLKR